MIFNIFNHTLFIRAVTVNSYMFPYKKEQSPTPNLCLLINNIYSITERFRPIA